MPTRVGKIFVSLIETLKMEERNSHIDELIAVFLSRGLDKEAREELEAWISASEDNRRYFMQQQEIWFPLCRKKNVCDMTPTRLSRLSANGWPNIGLRNAEEGYRMEVCVQICGSGVGGRACLFLLLSEGRK